MESVFRIPNCLLKTATVRELEESVCMENDDIKLREVTDYMRKVLPERLFQRSRK